MSTTTRYATYTGPHYRIEVDGVQLVRGVPREVPQGKLTVLRSHPQVVVSEDASAPEPEAPEADTPEPQEA